MCTFFHGTSHNTHYTALVTLMSGKKNPAYGTLAFQAGTAINLTLTDFDKSLKKNTQKLKPNFSLLRTIFSGNYILKF